MAKITIFGLAGTGKSSVGKMLAEQLGYANHSSGNIFRKQAEKMGMDLYEYDAYCNSHPELDRQFDKEIEDFGKANDNFVFEGRLAWHFIPDSFKIKFFCDEKVRIQRVADRDVISFIEARAKTLAREADGVKRYSETYGITEYAPDKAFDLIVDTTAMPIGEIVATIRAKLGF